MKAYSLDRPPREGEGMSAKDEKWKSYSAWFVPMWPLADEAFGEQQIWTHVDPPEKWTKNFWRMLEKLKGNIRAQGLLNPVLVYHKNGQYVLHPGKCRAWALKMLGIHYAPAIVCYFDRDKPKIVPAAYEIRSAAQLNEHFRGDIAPEMTRRGIRTPKMR